MILFFDSECFYICLCPMCRRALSSSSVDGVCAMLNHACAILEQDFREVLFSKLRQGFPVGFDFTQAYNLVQSSFAQGRLQSADAETEKLRAVFLVRCINVCLLSHCFLSFLIPILCVNLQYSGRVGCRTVNVCFCTIQKFSFYINAIVFYYQKQHSL